MARLSLGRVVHKLGLRATNRDGKKNVTKYYLVRVESIIDVHANSRENVACKILKFFFREGSIQERPSPHQHQGHKPQLYFGKYTTSFYCIWPLIPEFRQSTPLVLLQPSRKKAADLSYLSTCQYCRQWQIGSESRRLVLVEKGNQTCRLLCMISRHCFQHSKFLSIHAGSQPKVATVSFMIVS
jgi:hypothetical protein